MSPIFISNDFMQSEDYIKEKLNSLSSYVPQILVRKVRNESSTFLKCSFLPKKNLQRAQNAKKLMPPYCLSMSQVNYCYENVHFGDLQRFLDPYRENVFFFGKGWSRGSKQSSKCLFWGP